jgi:hypothetical protein
MFSSRFARVALLAVVVAAGVWVLFRGTRIAPEGVARQEAVAGFAPVSGGRAASTSLDPAQVEGHSAPVVVNLRDVAPGIYDPNNQFDRWQRGEIDLEENEGIVSEEEMEALRAASLKLPPSAALEVASAAPALAAPAPSTGFDSIDYNECCGGGGNVPPDPELAVGPNHVIAVVNVAFEIYDKNGNSLRAPTTFASFMGSNPSCSGVFDPNALYDEQADRFILGIDADGTAYCLAVSQTGDPMGAWNIYAFPTGSSRAFFDYPHAGVGNGAIYMGGNIFRCTFISCTFQEARVWAFDKTAMYNGASAAYVSQGLATSEDTPQPLNLHGWNQGTWPGGGPHYFFTNTNYNGATYSIFSWNDPFGANSFSQVGTVNLQTATGVTAGMPVNVPQLGGSSVQANDFRPQDLEYRNGYAWSVQTIACNPGGGTVNCIRWAQMDPSSATVVNAGVYASNGEYRFFGDLAVNACDDMAVGYTKSSSSMYPGVYYTGRQSGDPAGTLQTEIQLKAGELTYTAFDSVPRRWGDYTEMTIDPDGVTFWYLGEYSKNTGNNNGRWGTYIGAFSYSCDVGGGPTPTPTNTPVPPTPTNTPLPPTPTNTPVPPTPTNTPEPGDTTMHIADLDDAGSINSGRNWIARVLVTVVDSSNNPVGGAAVTGQWDVLRSSTTCTTDSNGTCLVIADVRKNFSGASFSVTDVSSDSLQYDPGANADPDGDSDGTTITVFK